jgi:hypothetical protein
MTQHDLNMPDIRLVLQQMSGHRVAQGVRRHFLGYPGLADDLGDNMFDRLRRQAMAFGAVDKQGVFYDISFIIQPRWAY